MGAGSITSNVKSDKTLVTVKYQGEKITTGLKKFGAILGGLRGGWLQLCSEPRKRHMSQQQYLSLIYGAGVVPPKASIKQLRKSLKKF